MLERLEPFIGEWDLEPSFPTLPGATGRTVFEWALDGRFLVQRTEISVPEAPNSICAHRRRPPRRTRSRSTTSTRAASSASTR